MARFDVSFDVRDRARFIKALVVDVNEHSEIAKHLVDILLGAKGRPTTESPYTGMKCLIA